MAVNWAGGLIRWMPHRDKQGRVFRLNHLHPFRMHCLLAAGKGHPARDEVLHVGFGLHCFSVQRRGVDDDTISDNRESRAFDHARYALSRRLPQIIRSVAEGRQSCERASADNYVAVELDNGERYGVFFNLKRWTRHGANSVLLLVQSAYPLDPGKRHPGKGRYSFNLLLGEVLRGRAHKSDEPDPQRFAEVLEALSP
ncbi:hypothetical protein [Stenotrophomonas sp. PD6]|uniref:hypothetical protein n=1 Tax=Stenotrophomonas sp. PD6 TaxID=3368612 RepID=UPI003BA15726